MFRSAVRFAAAPKIVVRNPRLARSVGGWAPGVAGGRLVCLSEARALTRSPLVRLLLQPPVQLQSLSGKYATAAFTGALAKSADTLKQVETDLQAINKLIAANDKSVVFFGPFPSLWLLLLPSPPHLLSLAAWNGSCAKGLSDDLEGCNEI